MFILSTQVLAVAPSPTPTPTTSPSPTPAPIQVELTEIMACPEAGENEWIELHNPTTESVTLTNWKVRDSADHTKTVSLEILAGEYIVADWVGSLLNNTGDELFLENDETDVLLSIELPACSKGSSFILVEGKWTETSTPSPAEKNPDIDTEKTQDASTSAQISVTATNTDLTQNNTVNATASALSQPLITGPTASTFPTPPPAIPYQFPNIPIAELKTANPFRGRKVHFQTYKPNRTSSGLMMFGGILLSLIGLTGLLKLVYKVEMSS